MSVRTSVLLVALCACAARTLPPAAWRATPPVAPCEVVETYTDAMGADKRLSRYDAAGRLVFAQTRLTYDGHGFEHVTWKDDRVARIDSYYEQAFRQGNCDVEGGCDEPAFRTVETSVYRYDSAGRLRAIEHEKREYRERNGTWTEHDDDDDEVTYEYKNGQLVAIDGGDNGDAEFVWSNGHPVERHFDGRKSTYTWDGDRLVMYRWFDYAQSFEYDAAGRLVREVLASKDKGPGGEQITTWSYDESGHVTSETRTERTREVVLAWTYDDKGRITSAAQDGRVHRTFAYGASCPAGLRTVRAPSALQRTGLDVCIRSPGYGYDNCFYAQR